MAGNHCISASPKKLKCSEFIQTPKVLQMVMTSRYEGWSEWAAGAQLIEKMCYGHPLAPHLHLNIWGMYILSSSGKHNFNS